MGSSKGKKKTLISDCPLSLYVAVARSVQPCPTSGKAGVGEGAARTCRLTLLQDNAWVWPVSLDVSLQIRSPLVGFLGLRSNCFFNSTHYDSHLS